MSLFLLLGVGQTSYGFSSEITSLQNHDTSKHHAVVERANDKAVGVEQLTLAEPEISVSAQQQKQADRFSSFNSSGIQNYSLESPVDSNYFEQSLLISPSCSNLVLIFPFHLFP